MTEKFITIVFVWSTRSHLCDDGTVDYTTSRPHPGHLDFYYVDNKKLMLDNAEVTDISIKDNCLTIKENVVHGCYVGEYHLLNSDRVALERFLAEK